MTNRMQQAKTNRERMPQTAAIVDAFRAVFGPGVAVLHAREDGIELGRPGQPGVLLSVGNGRPEKA